MRTALVVLVVLLAAAMVAGATSNRMTVAEKNLVPKGTPTYEGRDVGDNIAAPIIVGSLPFTETGNTCAYLDDYDVTCPYPGSTSPDVVYSYSPVSDVTVDVSLCGSTYDTKVYIFENAEGNVVCCNDDACGPNGYQSEMRNVFLYAGNQYYFVVDGYGGDCGDYEIQITAAPPCDVVAPVGAILEGEPTCGPGYVDDYNAGCNAEPAAFYPLNPSGDTIVLFGTSGTYDEMTRDTDWYEIYVQAPNTVTLSAVAEFPVRIFFINGNTALGCDDPEFVISTAEAGPCETATLTETVGPGYYWLWVGPSVYACQPCGLEYIIEVDGYVGPSPVDDVSWSTVKAIYR